MNERDLLQKRAKCIADARAIHERGEAEKRALTAEEETQYNAFIEEAASLYKRAQRAANMESLSDELEQSDGDESGARTEPETRSDPRALGSLPERYAATVRQMQAAGDLRTTPEYQRAFRGFLLGDNVRGIQKQSEKRDLQADIDPQGGFLKSPPQFVAGLLQAVDDILFFRQPGWATVVPMASADELVGVSLDADPDDGEWTSEIGEITYDTSMAFGKRSLKPNTLAKGIKLSRKLLRVAPDAERIVTDRLRYKLAVPMERKYMLGTGVNQPLGVFVASNDGIPTSRDVSTGNTATTIQFDGLLEAKFTLKPQYWGRAKWLFHRDAIKQLAKLQDDDGRYIWMNSVMDGQPDTLFGIPVYVSEYAPNTFTSGSYVGMLGDFSFYWIADAMNLEIQRVLELYSKTRQIGLHAWLETDGMPVMAEAFVRVKLA